MILDSIKDIRLTGRALVSGWLDNCTEKKTQAISTLFDLVQNGNDEARVAAFKALVAADMADLKRSELELKKQALDDAKRLRLLELIKHLPPGAIAAILPGGAAIADSGRADEGQREESQS